MIYIPFYAALGLYALFSSPTPDIIGWAEYTIAGLLILSVGFAGGWNTISRFNYPNPFLFHHSFLIYMLSIPMVVGVINAHPLSDIIRDYIPILLLIIPLWVYDKHLPYFAEFLMILGGLLALRYLLPFLSTHNIEHMPLLYLANSPLVPFAAIYGFHCFLSNDYRALFLRLIGLAFSITCIIAMAFMLQRAPLSLTILACMAILILRATHKPITVIMIISLGIYGLTLIAPLLLALLDSMSGKTLTVGWNNRFTEFQAVLIQTSWLGEGWGSIWQSPAVADIWVRYTHNFISYFLLKAGIIGGLMATIFIYIWGRQIVVLLKQNPALGFALIVPFLIHVTLYAGFKSLDFALILAVVSQGYQSYRKPYAVPDEINDEIDPDYQSCFPADLRRDGANGV